MGAAKVDDFPSAMVDSLAFSEYFKNRNMSSHQDILIVKSSLLVIERVTPVLFSAACQAGS